MNAKASPPHTAPEELSGEHFSYLRLLFILIGSIFLAEVASTIIVYQLPKHFGSDIRAIIDAGITVVLVFPLLYFLSFRPLMSHIEKRQKAERFARAERQRFNDILETLPGYLVLLTPDYHVPFANGFFRERFGEAHGQRCYEYLFGRDQPCEICETYKVLKTMQPGRWKWTGPDSHIYDVYDFPFTDTDGATLILEMGIDITEQKQAEAQVHEMALFPALNPNAVLQVDTTGQIRKINPAAAEMGFAVGTQLTEVIPDLRELDLAACIAAGATQHIQREAHLGESVLLWSVRGVPDLGLAFLYSKDITLYRHAEGTVRQLSRIVEQTEDMVVVTNRDGVIEYVNLAFERLTGYTKEEVLGKTPRVIKSDLHNKTFYQNLWNTILAGEVFQSEMTNRKKNGEIYYEVKTITPLRDAQGNITHFVATGKDITEHKLDEEKLQRAYDELELRVQERTEELRDANEQLSRSESTLQSILDATQESIWLFSPEGIILMANKTALSRAKMPAEEILGKHFNTLMPANVAQLRMASLTKVVDTGQPLEFEDQRAGIIFHHNFYPVKDANGCVTGVAAFSRDITERRQAQEREQQLNRTLKALNRSNQVMLRSRSEAELLNEVCKIIIEDCGHAMVWIGFKEEDEQRSVRPVASAGFEEGYIETLKITWADTERGRGPTGAAVRTGEARRCCNMLTDPQFAPWREQALKRGYASSIALPLKVQENIFGAVTIYSRQPDSFADEEERLLTELAGDLAYGITALRLRAAHAQAEEALRKARDELELRVQERTQELERRNVELQIISNAERNQRQLSEALVEAALIVNKSLKLDEVLVLILKQIKEVIPYRIANIALSEGESFYDASCQGDLEWPMSSNQFLLESFPLINKMRQPGKPILIPDTEKEPNWVTAKDTAPIRCFLSAPLLVEEEAIGFVNLFGDQPGFFTQEMSNRLVAFAAHATVAIQNAWLFEQVRASSERLQSLSRRLVEIQENERLYIARELHDEAGQMLTSLMLDLITLETQADQPEAVLKKVVEMEEMLNAVSENLHNVAMALRPASLDHLGLVPALRQYVESVGERYKLKSSFTSGSFQERLPANMETELYRIVQEALTNVARHAHASQVDVILTMRDHKLIVMVEDDGKGFDPEKVPDAGHLGLFGMRERVEMIGGQLVIESKPGKGTTIMVEVDYDSPTVDRG